MELFHKGPPKGKENQEAVQKEIGQMVTKIQLFQSRSEAVSELFWAAVRDELDQDKLAANPYCGLAVRENWQVVALPPEVPSIGSIQIIMPGGLGALRL